MTDMVSLLAGASKRASIDEQLINKKMISLRDCKKLVSKVRDDIANEHRMMPMIDLGGILAISFATVADVIRDSAAQIGEAEFPALRPINMVYDKARKYRNEKARNKMGKELSAIGKVLEAAKKKAPKGPGGDMFRVSIDTFFNLAQNTCLLLTYMEDSQETRKTVVRSLNETNKLLDRISAQLANLEHWAAIGEGAKPIQRMTPAIGR